MDEMIYRNIGNYQAIGSMSFKNEAVWGGKGGLEKKKFESEEFGGR